MPLFPVSTYYDTSNFMYVSSLQQTPAYSRHTLHQDTTVHRTRKPLYRHQSLGERCSHNAITHFPQVHTHSHSYLSEKD